MAAKPKASELLQVLVKMFSYFQDVRLIFDALDECGDHTRAIAKHIKELGSHEAGNVSLAIFSRDETDIRDFFAPPVSKHIEISAHTEDVEQYVRTEVESRLDNKKLRVRNPSLKEEIVTKLVSKAGGMWVNEYAILSLIQSDFNLPGSVGLPANSTLWTG